MLKEFLEYLLEETKTEALDLDGREYTSKAVVPVKTPLPEPLKFNTLTGFAEFAKIGGASDRVIHVVDHATVHLKAADTDAWEQRAVDAVATTAQHQEAFRFGTYLDPEQFIVGVQALFVPSEHRELILKLAGNLSSESSLEVEDDGVTQRVGQKAGVVLKSRASLPPFIVLAPWRTFREAEQPASTFIVRARKEREGQLPNLALFEADGGAWRLQAIQNVAKVLTAALPEWAVLA